MFDLAHFTLEQFIVFTLVLTRLGGLVATAPLYGTQTPAQVRASLALALAVLVTPSQWAGSLPAPQALSDYLLMLGGELLVGLTLGLGMTLLFSGVQLAGQIIGQTSGMTLAEVFNPGFDGSIPLISQALYLLALAIFVTLGGHRLLMAGLLGTFATIPIGGAGLSAGLGEAVVVLLTQSFSLGIRIAAPATAALLLATLVMGLVSRTLPQLNLLTLGFGLNALAAFGILAMSLGGLSWAFQAEIEPALQTILEALG
ncbi:MAG: flagellar biosynthetic protein FliR [Pirellulales bacterium]